MKITDKNLIEKLLEEFETIILSEETATDESSPSLFSESANQHVRYIISEEGISWYYAEEPSLVNEKTKKEEKEGDSDDIDNDDDNEGGEKDEEKKVKKESISVEIPKLTDKDIDITEEFKQIFSNIDIDEEVKTKLYDLFTINLVNSINEEVASYASTIEDLFNKKVETKVTEHIDEMESNIDKYLTYTVNEWTKENQLVMEDSIKLNLYEQLFKDMSSLLESYNLNIPENSDHIIQAKDKQIQELEEKYKEQVDNAIKLTELTEKMLKESIISEETKDLSSVAKEKLMKLVENIDISTDPEIFKKKVQNIRESIMDNPSVGNFEEKLDISDINTEFTIEEEEEIPESMKSYIKYLKR